MAPYYKRWQSPRHLKESKGLGGGGRGTRHAKNQHQRGKGSPSRTCPPPLDSDVLPAPHPRPLYRGALARIRRCTLARRRRSFAAAHFTDHPPRAAGAHVTAHSETSRARRPSRCRGRTPTSCAARAVAGVRYLGRNFRRTEHHRRGALVGRAESCADRVPRSLKTRDPINAGAAGHPRPRHAKPRGLQKSIWLPSALPVRVNGAHLRQAIRTLRRCAHAGWANAFGRRRRCLPPC